LVAYLANHARWIAADDETREELWQRRHEWNLLQQNLLVTGTGGAAFIPLRHRDGGHIRFRDMRGADAIDSKADAADLRKAAAALVFLEWPSHRSVVNEIAVHNALAQLPPATPRAMVITKCESRLSPQQFLSCVVDPKAFAATAGVPALRKLFESFDASAIFPITVYGWKGDRPAQYYNEFGQFVPWCIEPAMVERPFDYIVEMAMREERT
jgi:hypothetical protein